MSVLAGACHLGSALPGALIWNVEGNDDTAEFSKDGAKVNCNNRKSIPKLMLAARKLRMEYGRPATEGNLLGKENSIVFLGTRRKSVRETVVKMVERWGILARTNCPGIGSSCHFRKR